jgi:hypothetical protein
MEITPELFEKQRSRRFGNANPEKMQFAFWEWMVRGGDGPYRVRELFKVPFRHEDGPIWTFNRMGVTRSELPDGRSISVGGEYEDYYDPDFCIYNDVIVQGPTDKIEIYAYPADIFPPTDFHTATVVDRCIVIVGGLGYQQSRRPGYTPVYSLDLADYHMSELRTTGENPGWIFRHQADLEANGTIKIWGGEVIQENGEKQRYRRTLDDYTLDTRSWVWVRTTNRNWRQLSIRQENGGLFIQDGRPKPEALLPRSIDYVRASCEEWNGARIIVEGVAVTLTVGVYFIDLIIEGDLSTETSARLIEDIRHNAEAATGSRCIFD